MIKIELFKATAQIEDGIWKSSNAKILSILQSYMKVYNSLSQPYTPDRDYTIAQKVCDAWGGRITHHDIVAFDPDVVY